MSKNAEDCESTANKLTGEDLPMSRYESDIAKAAQHFVNDDIPNSTCDHAEIGIRYLFQNAHDKSTVRILAGDFFDDFWKTLDSDISNFIREKGGRIEVIVTDTVGNYLKEIQALFADSVLVWEIAGKLKKFAKAIPHFVVIDPVGYRIEESDSDKQGKIVTGVLNYGNKEQSNILRVTFDQIKTIATSKKITPQ